MAVFDYTSKDAQAMPIDPMAPAQFDFARYEAHAQAAEARCTPRLRRNRRALPSGSGCAWPMYSAMDVGIWGSRCDGSSADSIGRWTT